MSDELCFLSAAELSALYRARKLSPLEAARAALDRIERINPLVNALFYVDRGGTEATARQSEERWRRGEPLGEFDGVPITLKDSIPVTDMPMPCGTRALAGRAPTEPDAPVTARLREGGAVLLGKTTMPDFGMIASGVSSIHGTTRNPWDLACNSGGSSSGAGAAVAAGLGAVAVGSDIGGSVRIPAAFCGVTGLKPSYGRIPLAQPWQALVAGPIARSVRDVAEMLGLLARPDVRDYTSLPYDSRDYLEGIDAGVRGRRFGLLLDIGFGLAVQDEVRAKIEQAARLFESLGALVEPLERIFDEDPEQDFDRMLQAYAWPDFAALDAQQQCAVMPEIADWCRRGEGLSAGVLADAMAGVGRTRRRVIAATAAFDFVLAPTMAIEPYGAERPWPSGGTQHNPFCFPFNLSEQPALSICCGFTRRGLPVGLQIIGRRFDDAGVLRAGFAYEAARPALPRIPRAVNGAG